MSLKKKFLAATLATSVAAGAMHAPQAHADENAIAKTGIAIYLSSMGSTSAALGSSGSSNSMFGKLFWYLQILNPVALLGWIVYSIGEGEPLRIFEYFSTMSTVADTADWLQSTK